LRKKRSPEEKKSRASRHAKELVIHGVLRRHPRGFGFVVPEKSEVALRDIFIPKIAIHGASDGDLVQVRVLPDSITSEKGPEGTVTGILQRSRDRFLAIYHNEALLIKGLDDVSTDFEVVAPGHTLVEGERLLVRITRWPTEHARGVAEIVKSLGLIADSAQDVLCAVEEFSLRDRFPEEVVAEAEAYGKRVSTADIKGREDLRKIECFTIDPETAKDFDDALSLIKTPDGRFQLGVHIADVAHYVQPGSLLDVEARKRCNSTYFPGRCIPMIPHQLSDHLCSLRPKVNRLAVTVFMEFSAQGELLRYRIARSVIKSAMRFTYAEAKDILDGKKSSPHGGTLLAMQELCHILRSQRTRRGSLELALPGTSLIVDDEGNPIRIVRYDYDITHQLVEEFMLKANEVVAAHLTKKGMPVAYRIHQAPSPSDFKDFVAAARGLGYRIAEQPTQAEIIDLFDQLDEPDHRAQLSTAFIKSMKLAYYSADNIGHYGLGLQHYCHFTSPIRRYPDLVAQRALFGSSEPYLAEVTEACSDQERRSAKAEESVTKLKKLRLVERLMAEAPDRGYEAIITKAKPAGIIFDILELQLEGFLHVSDLGNEFFHFNERKMFFRGESSSQKLGLGSTILVKPTAVDLCTSSVTWQRADNVQPSDSKSDKYSRKQKSKSRRR